MAFAGFDKEAFNLRFISAQNAAQGLAGYLQGFFGQCAGVVRKVGVVSVASGATTGTVVDADIAATDVVFLSLKTKGANAVVVSTVVITAAQDFVVTVSGDPGSGGADYNYQVVRPVSHT